MLDGTKVYSYEEREPDNPKREVLEVESTVPGVYHLWTWSEVLLSHSYNGGPVKEDWFADTAAKYEGYVHGAADVLRLIRAF